MQPIWNWNSTNHCAIRLSSRITDELSFSISFELQWLSRADCSFGLLAGIGGERRSSIVWNCIIAPIETFLGKKPTHWGATEKGNKQRKSQMPGEYIVVGHQCDLLSTSFSDIPQIRYIVDRPIGYPCRSFHNPDVKRKFNTAMCCSI